MTVQVFDDHPCLLGEGPLWHPLRKQLFWFDIMGRRMLSRDAGGRHVRQFDRHVSAAGWIDETRLMVATERDLAVVDLESGAETSVAPLEADDPTTRSNDGRADPQGGFWIGTMGKHGEAGKGALYRFHRGQIRKLASDIGIPNAICFAPSGDVAHFADTARHLVWRIALDADGWPEGEWSVFLDHRETGINPDGAVMDRNGLFWCAEWGGSRVAAYDAKGSLVKEIGLPAPQVTCPAFGSPDMETLYVTSARQGMPSDALDDAPLSGQTFAIPGVTPGQTEHRVIH